ncbi:MAG: hydroxyacid dehydrogenase [Clostridia bacterium]|nr:hydroxyacid dehydrogenase [Clostridia bacterium]
MKSYRIGSDVLDHVYDNDTRTALEQEAGMVRRVTCEDVLSGACIDADYLFSTWGMPCFSEEEICRCLPLLKGVFYGAGTVQTFARPFLNLQIPVFSAWAANAVPVAEYTAAQIVLANKGFFLACRQTRNRSGYGQAKAFFHKMPGNYRANIGIVGAGMIGKMVIERLKAYDLSVMVFDPFLSDEKADALVVKKVALKDLFAQCQVISNHVANLPETFGMLNYDLFSLMPENGVFINTGRGAQVVEQDLIRALKEKPDRCAILDVTMPEPPEENSPLYTMDNVFLTPHIAGSSGNEVARMGKTMLEQFRKFISGQPCEYEVTLEMLKTMA